MTRKIFTVGFVAGIVGLALACDGGDESSSSGGNGTSSGASGGNGSAFKDCSITTGTSCTEAEMKPYSDCLLSKCDAAYKKCYGDGYRSGSFSGPCGTWIACVQKCDCSDTGCILACQSDDACQTCASEVESCHDTCEEPECSKQGVPDSGDGGSATCADLQACCDSMEPGEKKDGCQSAKDGSNGDDATCAQYYGTFKAASLCD